MIKKCKYCGMEFEAKSAIQKYCSDICRDKDKGIYKTKSNYKHRSLSIHISKKDTIAPKVCRKDGETYCTSCSKPRCRYG